jgi:hypothetical protein
MPVNRPSRLSLSSVSTGSRPHNHRLGKIDVSFARVLVRCTSARGIHTGMRWGGGLCLFEGNHVMSSSPSKLEEVMQRASVSYGSQCTSSQSFIHSFTSFTHSLIHSSYTLLYEVCLACLLCRPAAKGRRPSIVEEEQQTADVYFQSTTQ